MQHLRWSFDVDVVGRCNLSCPSCPVGNMSGTPLQTGYMSPDFLDQIVVKATSECKVTNFALYNWTEPFIHPDLPEMIRVVKAHDIGCDLSTNLNLGKQIDKVVAANPDVIKISVSGFNQENYGITHHGGDIEVVKANMKRLAASKKAHKSSTRIIVIFHRYLKNQQEELDMRELAASLGFDFTTYWAYLMPLEKNLAFLGYRNGMPDFNEGDKALVNRLALPLLQAIEVARTSQVSDCRLRERQMAINSEGKVMLCCSVFDQSRYELAPYLDTPLDELQTMKYAHSMCSSCMKEGLHVLMTYGDKRLEDLALENVRLNNPNLDMESVYGNTGDIRNRLLGLGKSVVKAASRSRRHLLGPAHNKQ